MSTEIKHAMPLDEALAWVATWRNRHFNKVMGTKDRALVTLAAEVISLNQLLEQLSAPVKAQAANRHEGVSHEH